VTPGARSSGRAATRNLRWVDYQSGTNDHTKQPGPKRTFVRGPGRSALGRD